MQIFLEQMTTNKATVIKVCEVSEDNKMKQTDHLDIAQKTLIMSLGQILERKRVLYDTNIRFGLYAALQPPSMCVGCYLIILAYTILMFSYRFFCCSDQLLLSTKS